MSAADRNLLFAVVALQADLIDKSQFAEICSAWAGRKDTPLSELLVERGWLASEDRADLERLLERKLKKHDGDVRASLAEVASDSIVRSLADIQDADLRHSLADLPRPAGHVLLSATGDYTPDPLGRYTLTRLHATGGIGRVWLARDDDLGRIVALKEIRPERADNPMLWARFLKEAKITGQLEHPGIVPVYELAHRSENQAPFYTMRFIKGRTLTEAIRAFHGRELNDDRGTTSETKRTIRRSSSKVHGSFDSLPFRELLNAFIGICNAIAYAHAHGVVHRDLKPDNVVLGDFGEVIVLDWGLAKVVGEPEAVDGLQVMFDDEAHQDRTLPGQKLGTPAYMAPEQAEGRLEQIDSLTDVYGLGTILYEILTSRPPFTGLNSDEIIRKVCVEPPPPPRRVGGSAVPPALEAVCLKALSKKRENRFRSAKDLAAEVQHWLADEPVSAYREPWRTRAGRWCRKHRALVTSAAAVLLVAAIASIIGLGVVAKHNRDLMRATYLMERLGALHITSPDLLHVNRLPLEFATDKHTYAWRAYVPSSGKYQLRIAVSNLPPSGLPGGEAWPDFPFQLAPTDEGNASLIGVALFKRDDGWHLTVFETSGLVRSTQTLRVPAPLSTPLDERVGMENFGPDTRGTMVLEPGAESLVLLEWRRYHRTPEGKAPVTGVRHKPREEFATGAGLLVWIERAPANEPR